MHRWTIKIISVLPTKLHIHIGLSVIINFFSFIFRRNVCQNRTNKPLRVFSGHLHWKEMMTYRSYLVFWRCDLGQSGLFVCCGRSAGSRLCSSWSPSYDTYNCRVYGGVCSQEPDLLVETQRGLGKRNFVFLYFNLISCVEDTKLHKFSTPTNQFSMNKLVIYLVEHSCKVFTEKCDFL